MAHAKKRGATPAAAANAPRPRTWSLPTLGTRTPGPVSAFKPALTKYMQARTGLDRYQLTHLAKTGAELTRRRAGQREEDAIVQRNFPARVHTFQDIFKRATSVKFLSNGVAGVTFLVQYPAMAAPVVVKFAETPKTGGCHGKLLCTVLDGQRLGRYAWTGVLSTDRERKLSAVFSDIESERDSPHFLHTFTTASLAIDKPCSLKEIALWAGAPAAKVARFKGANRMHSMSVNVLEFGGMPFADILKSVIPKLRDDDAVNVLRGFLAQVMQALAVMGSAWDLRHNDCHTENVLGALTSSPYLHYEVVMHGKPGVHTRAHDRDVVTNLYFRVPTYGVLYRIIDFGHTTSCEEFGKDDHGLMARTASGGPMWRSAVEHPVIRQMPVEVFDLARVLDLTYDEVSRCGKQARATIRKDILGIAKAAIEFGKKVPDSIPIKDVQRFREIPDDTFSGAAKQQRLQKEAAKLNRAMADHGCMLNLFVRTAAGFGFGVKSGADDFFRASNAYTFDAQANGTPCTRK
jgi:hypothetical protein